MTDPSVPGGAALLDRARDLLKEAECLSLDAVAGELLKTPSPELGIRVLRPLLEQDPRFRVENGAVALEPEEDAFRDRPVGGVPLAALDFETSGTGPDARAIEIGVACFDGGIEGECFSTLLDPGVPVSRFVTELTGIVTEDLAGKPSFAEVWPEILSLLEGRVLMAHNLPFDRRVLRKELAYAGLAEFGGETFCTLRFARCALPRKTPASLDALSDRYGLFAGRRHRALDDAVLCGSVFYRLLEGVLEESDLSTWGDLRDFVAPAGKSAARSGPRGD